MTMTTEKQFKFYLFNATLNGVSIAVYESDKSFELIAEEDGEEATYESDNIHYTRYARERIEKGSLGDSSVSQYMAEKFSVDESDLHCNGAQALEDVLNGLSLRTDAEEELGSPGLGG